MGAHLLSIAEKDSADNSVGHRGHGTLSACLRGVFAVKYYIVGEFVRGDIYAYL
jgi:hypothetical protein